MEDGAARRSCVRLALAAKKMGAAGATRVVESAPRTSWVRGKADTQTCVLQTGRKGDHRLMAKMAGASNDWVH